MWGQGGRQKTPSNQQKANLSDRGPLTGTHLTLEGDQLTSHQEDGGESSAFEVEKKKNARRWEGGDGEGERSMCLSSKNHLPLSAQRFGKTTAEGNGFH